MSIIAWILMGLIAGFVASKMVKGKSGGLLFDVALGIAGAIVGGFVFTQVGAAGATGFDLYSMVVALAGSVVVLVGYHVLVQPRVSA